MQSDIKTGMADRPSERRRRGPLPPDLAGMEPRLPSTHARGQGGADCSEAVLRYPARHGGGGPPSVGRPSEATEQGVLCALCNRSRPSGRTPGRPAPPSPSRGGALLPGARRAGLGFVAFA
jgi:hypothetical protein